MASTGSDEKDILPRLDVTPHPLDLEIIDGDESLELTTQELCRLKRIVDWRILPYISLLYLLSMFWMPLNAHCRILMSRLPRFLGPRGFHLVCTKFDLFQLSVNAR